LWEARLRDRTSGRGVGVGDHRPADVDALDDSTARARLRTRTGDHLKRTGRRTHPELTEEPNLGPLAMDRVRNDECPGVDEREPLRRRLQRSYGMLEPPGRIDDDVVRHG
jgi:hypothetical protein